MVRRDAIRAGGAEPDVGWHQLTGGERSLVLLAAISVSGAIENEPIKPRGILSRLFTD